MAVHVASTPSVAIVLLGKTTSLVVECGALATVGSSNSGTLCVSEPFDKLFVHTPFALLNIFVKKAETDASI